MGIVRHVLLPSFLLPFRLFSSLGGSRTSSPYRFAELDYSASDSEYGEEGDQEEDLNQTARRQHFMNHEFATSMRSTSGYDCDVKLPNPSRFRPMSSRRDFDGSQFSATPDNVDVDVLLEPSAFAFIMVPNETNEKGFCSRDDSEIAVRSPLFENEDNRVFTRIDSQALHPNAAYLYPKYSCDDMEIGMFTEKKTPLRHMGSAIVYKRELSGSSLSQGPDCFSPYPSPSPDFSQSLRLNSFKERNQMVRLESIVGRVQSRPNSRTEFGVLDARGCELIEARMNQAPISPRPRSRTPSQGEQLNAHSSRQLFVKSYPVSFLSRLSEEDSSSDLEGEPQTQDSAEELTGRSSRQLYTTKSSRRCPSSRSCRRFRISSADFEKNGTMNPHYECPDDLYPIDYQEEPFFEHLPSSRFEYGLGAQAADLPTDARPAPMVVARNDSRRAFLLERYLAASFVRDQMTPTNTNGSIEAM